MTPVLVPVSDVNSESVTLVVWHVPNRAKIGSNDSLADVETSKAALEIPSPADGFVLQLAEVGAEVPLTDPIALVFDDETALQRYEDETRAARQRAAEGAEAEGPRATLKARERAAELGVDLGTVTASGLITVRDVDDAAARRAPRAPATLPAPLPGSNGRERVLLIGAGLGATQVMDIFADSGEQQAVAIVDDDPARWGEQVGGVPVVGGGDRIVELLEAGGFDTAIVTISTSIAARRKFREACRQAGVRLANAIDPRSKLASGVTIGEGNVICAFCHFGMGTTIGDNNFISAFNSFDHHNVLGSDISTGPGCMTSGEVRIGDGVRMGTGIFVEPKVELGDGVQVASGAIILRSVPAEHAVKTKVVTTTVVPLRRGGPATG